jgi:hypothetical protein
MSSEAGRLTSPRLDELSVAGSIAGWREASYGIWWTASPVVRAMLTLPTSDARSRTRPAESTMNAWMGAVDANESGVMT